MKYYNRKIKEYIVKYRDDMSHLFFSADVDASSMYWKTWLGDWKTRKEPRCGDHRYDENYFRIKVMQMKTRVLNLRDAIFMRQRKP